MDTGQIIAVVLSAAGAIGAGAATFLVLHQYHPVALKSGEETVRKQQCYLMTRQFRSGRNGQLVLTNQRLLWTPTRHLSFGAEPITLDLRDIDECVVGERRAKMLWTSRPLVVRTQRITLEFYLTKNPLKPFASDFQDSWNAAIAARKGGQRHRL